MTTILKNKMTAHNTPRKNAILQYHSKRYTITIPEWYVKKVLNAEKGSIIKFDFSGSKVMLENTIQ